MARPARFDGGWIAEMAIPFKSLRYARARPDVGHHPAAHDPRQERVSPTSRRCKRAVAASARIFRSSAAATLVGLEVPPAAVNLEIKPYAISRLTTDLLATPAVATTSIRMSALDVKYGVTKSLTADFTYNTDFAQVEADEVAGEPDPLQPAISGEARLLPRRPGHVHVRRRGERRAALTGATAASGASDAPTIFYSRRIGLGASGAVPILARRPRHRAGRPLQHRRAQHRQRRRSASPRDQRPTSPCCGVRRDVLRRSTIGGAVHQPLRRRLRRPAPTRCSALDGTFAFFQNVYVSGYVAKTRTAGPRRRRRQLPRQLQLRGRPIRLPGSIAPWSGDNFIPEVGFLPRTGIPAQLRGWPLQPAPDAEPAGSPVFLRDQPELHHRQRESAGVAAAGRGDFRIGAAEQRCVPSRILSRLRVAAAGRSSRRRAFASPPAVTPFKHVRGAWSLGQQHPLSGTIAVEIGQFYDGDQAHRFDERALRHLASARR